MEAGEWQIIPKQLYFNVFNVQERLEFQALADSDIKGMFSSSTAVAPIHVPSW